jgi:hypothetical protein
MSRIGTRARPSRRARYPSRIASSCAVGRRSRRRLLPISHSSRQASRASSTIAGWTGKPLTHFAARRTTPIQVKSFKTVVGPAPFARRDRMLDETGRDLQAFRIPETPRPHRQSGAFQGIRAAIACFAATSKCAESYRCTSGSACSVWSQVAVREPGQLGLPGQPRDACSISQQRCDGQKS